MNQIVTLIIGGAFILWCVALSFRDQKWAFAGWLPFTIASVLGTLAWLSILPELGNSGGGAAEGFAALGAAMLFLYFLAAPVLLILSIKFRPRVYAFAVVIPTILILSIGVLVGARTLPKVDLIPVHLEFTSSDGVQLGRVTIKYRTWQKTNGFSGPTLEGDLETDSSGRVTVFTRVNHELTIEAKKDGFAKSKLTISNAIPAFHIHQCSLTWETQLPSDRYPQGRREMFDLPIGKELDATIFIPKINQTDLPYPAYNPSWLHR